MNKKDHKSKKDLKAYSKPEIKALSVKQTKTGSNKDTKENPHFYKSQS